MARIAKKVPTDSGIRFEFIDDTVIEADMDTLPEATIRDLARHGLSQKMGDSYAGAESVTEAYTMAAGVYKNLQAGLWSVKVSKGGKIVTALAMVTGKSPEECLEVWNGMSKDAQKALRGNAQIKVALAEIDAERAKALADAAEGSDGDDLQGLFE